MTEPNPSSEKKRSFFERQQTTLKALVIAFLLMCLLIPQNMVSGLIYEREYFRNAAFTEVSSKWSYPQTISGPVVSVPYIEFYKETPQSEFRKVIKFAHFLPEDLKVTGEMFPEKRYRGIYEVVVYNTKIHVEGYFERFNVASLGVPKENILWEYASICLGLDDLRGIEEQIALDWNGAKIAFNPGLEHQDVVFNGISAKVPIKSYADASISRYNFKFDLQLKGSETLYFTPIGKTTTVAVQSKWTNPSFDGAFLPDERAINTEGFTADWKVHHLNRSYPQSFLGNMNLRESSFGVNLKIPLDNYKQAHRAVKYAFILLSLTFALYFFIEMLNKRRIHAAHYILVGLALCLFYTLLVSMSEHIKFSYSYLIASLMTIGLITWYSNSILKERKLSYLIGATLSLVYAFIYIIVHLEDYALLVGSFGLFVALAIVMHYARKIDWYDVAN